MATPAAAKRASWSGAAARRGQAAGDSTPRREGEERLLGHRVDGVRRGEARRCTASSTPCGSLVPVLANSRRWGSRPGGLERLPARGPEERDVLRVRRRADREPQLEREVRGHAVRRPPASQRLMNSDATEATYGSGRPRRAARCPACRPRRRRGTGPGENSSVTLIGTPAKIASSIAPRPSRRARDLDEQVRAGRPSRGGASPAATSSPRRRRGAGSPRATRSRRRRRCGRGCGPEQVRGAAQVGERDLEERVLGRLRPRGPRSRDLVVVGVGCRRWRCRRSWGWT